MKQAKNESVVYVMNDKVGGVMSMNANLIQYRNDDHFTHAVVLLHNKLAPGTRFAQNIGADSQVTFEFSSYENIYSVARRLRQIIPAGPGVLVSNNLLELATLSIYDLKRTVIQIVHDEFNLRLAQQFEAVVDVFVAHSRFYFERLKLTFPARHDHIFYLPYGIPLSPNVRQPQTGPLRLVFLGRMVESKGIFDLPTIDRMLAARGTSVEWTVMGSGPKLQELQAQWQHPAHVTFCSPTTNAEVLEICTQQDIFVLPTRFEGLPVSLLETMSAGLVPVISDLPSGIPEVVTPRTGYRPAIGDCNGFAAAIAALDQDRPRLEAMSHACRRLVEENFDIRKRVLGYQALFARYREFQRPRRFKPTKPTNSRLDHPWIPNNFVRFVRQLRYRLGKAISNR